MSTRDQLAGYKTEIAVGKALSCIGFPCWLEEQQTDPLVLRLSARVPFGLAFTAPSDYQSGQRRRSVTTLSLKPSGTSVLALKYHFGRSRLTRKSRCPVMG